MVNDGSSGAVPSLWVTWNVSEQGPPGCDDGMATAKVPLLAKPTVWLLRPQPLTTMAATLPGLATVPVMLPPGATVVLSRVIGPLVLPAPPAADTNAAWPLAEIAAV